MRNIFALLSVFFMGVVPSHSQNTSAGITPAGTPKTLSATTSSSSIQLNAFGNTIVMWNVGAAEAFYKFQANSAPTAAITDYSLPAGGAITLSLPPNTYIAAITAASSTTIRITQGTGFPGLAYGGGSGGGGGGGAVTIADGADVTQGAVADVACATDNGTCTVVALEKRNNQRLTTINTTLGSPLQAGGAVTVNPTTAANWALAATGAAVPANAQYIGMVQGGNLTGLTGTSGNLNVQCANCSGSGVSTVDEAAFTAGTSLFAGTGGFFQTTATNNALTTGQQGMWQMTANRAGFINLRNASGVEIGVAGAEVFVGGRGTAGSAAGGVLTVQGVASMTPVQVSQATAATLNATVVGTGTFATQSAITAASGTIAAGAQVDLLTMRGTKNAGTAAANSLQAGGVYNSTPLTLTDAQQASLQFDANGYLKVNTAAGAAAGGTSSNFGSAFPTPGTAAGFTNGTNMTAASVGAVSNVAAATNYLNTLAIGQYNATPPTITDTRYNAVQLDVSGNMKVSATGLAQGSTTSGQTGSLILGAVTTSAPTYTTAQTSPFSLTTAGDIRTVFSNTTIAATNAGTFVVQPASATAPVSTMNSASANAGVTAANAFVFDDTSPTAITENSFGYGRMSANRNQYHTIRDAAGNERGANVTAGSALSSDLTSVAGTAIVTGGVAGSQGVGGTVATNVAITANPLNLGVQAVSSENTAVTTARQVQLVADLVGKLIVMPYANPENFVSGVITTAMTGTTTTSLVAAPAAGLRNYITACTFSNAHATVGTDIIIQDGSGGTTIWNVPAAAVYGGAHITFPTPLRQPTTATAIFVANVTTGASTKAACSGYKGA